MRPLLRTLARLAAACLTVAASVPGQLQLVHQHAGGEHMHVHADAEALAAHDLLEGHHHPHDVGHSHAEAHATAGHAHPHAAPAADDGPTFRAVAAFHVHGLNPLHPATCTTASCNGACVAVARADATVTSTPPATALRAARSRGPPTHLVG